jgi:hypothetical protein
MKITGHRTRGIFDRYHITDQSDTQEMTQYDKSRRINVIRRLLIWCGEGDLNPHEIAPASTSS